jgi:hypothetical protein
MQNIVIKMIYVFVFNFLSKLTLVSSNKQSKANEETTAVRLVYDELAAIFLFKKYLKKDKTNPVQF